MKKYENMGDYQNEYDEEEVEEEFSEDSSEEYSEKKPKKHLLYRLFNPENGKEPKAIPDGPDGLKKGFMLYGRNITNMLYVNLIKVIGNFPLIFVLLARSGLGSGTTTAASSGMFAPLHGVMLHKMSLAALALFGVHGGQSSQQYLTTKTYVFLALSLLVLFTWGVISTGTTYLLRGYIRQDRVFFWSDFFGAIKRNLKQAIIVGFIDALIMLLLFYDMYFFFANGSMMFFIMIIILAIYMMVRMYLYLMLITFDLSVWKIFKNGFIFAILGFKRNILAFLFGTLIVGLAYFLLGTIPPVGILFGLFIMFSTIAFFNTYAAWAKIKEIMIDPYVPDKKPKKPKKAAAE